MDLDDVARLRLTRRDAGCGAASPGKLRRRVCMRTSRDYDWRDATLCAERRQSGELRRRECMRRRGANRRPRPSGVKGRQAGDQDRVASRAGKSETETEERQGPASGKSATETEASRADESETEIEKYRGPTSGEN